MILNALIDGVEVRRSPGGDAQGLVVDLRFNDVKANGENIEAAFVYQANWEKDIGFLQMTGRLLLKSPSLKARDDVLKSWANDQTLPSDFAQEAMTAAHHVCAINSPFATRIVDLAPPILPMQVRFSPEQTQVGKRAAGPMGGASGAGRMGAPGAKTLNPDMPRSPMSGAGGRSPPAAAGKPGAPRLVRPAAPTIRPKSR